MGYTALSKNDLIRAHDFGPDRGERPACYLEGAVLEITGGFVYFALTKRVWGGVEEPVQKNEVGRCPINGASVFDDPDNARVEFIKHAPPCFTVDLEITRALINFKTSLQARGML